MSLSTDLSNARSEASRVGDSFVKRNDLETKAKALTMECQDLEHQVLANPEYMAKMYTKVLSSSLHSGGYPAVRTTAPSCPEGGCGR